MQKFVFSILFTYSLFLSASGQTIIYQQNFDGNNGTFTNTLLLTTGINGVFSNTTGAQTGSPFYRHLWSVDNRGTGNFAPISGRSLGLGFYTDLTLFYASTPFRTYNGTNCTVMPVTTRWAYIPISTVGFENIQVEFKWRCSGEIDEGIVYDYGTFFTSVNGGANWLLDETGGQGGTTGNAGSFSGGLYFNNSAVLTQTINLPSSRDDQANFVIGFRMVVDQCFGTGGAFIVDDIVVRGTPLLSCFGGTASPVYQYVETNNTASLTLTGQVGTSIQWQVSPNGTSSWTNVTGGTGASTINYTTSNLADGTYFFRAEVTDGTCTQYSNVVEVLVAANPVYCSGAGSGNTTLNNHLEGILFHEWSDPNPGYSATNYRDYTDTSTFGYATVVAGQYHHLSAVLRAQGTGLNSTTFAYWIDWNRDGVFDNTAFNSGGERMDNINYTSTVGNSYASYFTVPANSEGFVRIRIRVVRGNVGSLNPCTSYTQSQTKDFMVKILPSMGNQVCNGVNGNANNVLTNSTVDKVNITRVKVDGPSGTILDHNSGFFGVQAGATITMYNYSNMMGGFSNGLVFEAGQNYSVEVEHSGYTSAAGLFIDWDGNGTFSGSEELIEVISDAIANPFVFNFTAPSSLTNGAQVTMRVRLQYEDSEGAASSMTGCNNLTLGGLNIYSEVEDYRATLSEGTTLPVTWLNLSTNCLENSIEINWSTATEINNDYFEVFASTDGLEFSKIAEVNGAGNSNVINKYSVTYDSPNSTNYFKIKQTDFDGKFEYSRIIASNCNINQINFDVYPNPFDGSTLFINLKENSDVKEIKIYDITGKLVDKPTMEINEQQIKLLTSNKLVSGIYFIVIKDKIGNESMKKVAVH